MLRTDRILYINGLKQRGGSNPAPGKTEKDLTNTRLQIVLAMFEKDPKLKRAVKNVLGVYA